ncbi:MAG: branched-chain amino acid ABC transporter permease [Candidatus Heimdallarchaeota archaeon]
MKNTSISGEKPKELMYFVYIELVVGFFGILLAAIALLAEPSSELQGITPSMNVLLTLLDLFGGIALGMVLGLLQSLLIQDPALFLLLSSVVALLFGGLNLIVAWFLRTLRPRTYSSILLLATINISCGLFGMPLESFHLPFGIGGFIVNFAMIHVFMGSRTKELFGATPIPLIRLAAISQFLAGILFLVIGPYIYISLMGQDFISLAQTGVFIFGCMTGIASILVSFSLWTLRNGSYIQSITLALINTAVGMLQWPYGALGLALSLFNLYYLLQPSIQKEFQMTQKLNTHLIWVLEVIGGSLSILAGVSSAIAGFTGESGASIIGGTLAVLTGLVLLWIAWETRKYGIRSPYLTRIIILATVIANLIELGVDSFYQTPVGAIERGFGVVVLITCMTLLGISAWFGGEKLLELDKDRATWFNLFVSIAILLRLAWILSPSADVFSFSIDTAIWMSIFGILALSLNIEAGQTGLMNFGKVAFFAIGAYSTAILSRPEEPTQYGLNPGLALPFVVSVVFSVLITAFFGFLISIPTLRLRADYLAIVTITFGEILRFIFRDPKLNPTFGSTIGLEVSRPFVSFFERFGVFTYRLIVYLPLVIVCLLFCYLISNRILNSPFGRVLRSVREDELASQAMGKNVYQFKTKAFIIGSGMAGLAGSLFAAYITFIVESNFIPLVTFSIWIMVVVGGTGNNRGVIFGAILIQYFRRFTRFELPNYALFGFYAENFRFIVIGLLLIIFIMFRQEGVFKEEPTRTVATDIGLALKEKRDMV